MRFMRDDRAFLDVRGTLKPCTVAWVIDSELVAVRIDGVPDPAVVMVSRLTR